MITLLRGLPSTTLSLGSPGLQPLSLSRHGVALGPTKLCVHPLDHVLKTRRCQFFYSPFLMAFMAFLHHEITLFGLIYNGKCHTGVFKSPLKHSPSPRPCPCQYLLYSQDTLLQPGADSRYYLDFKSSLVVTSLCLRGH